MQKSTIPSLVILAASVFTSLTALAQSSWTNSSGNWSVAGNWSPKVIPGPATNVLFVNNLGAATTAGTVDNTVDLGFSGSIAALQYANTNVSNGAGYYHTTQIAAGETLTVTNGLTVGTLSDAGGNTVVNATITGAGGKLALTGGGMVINQASATGGTHYGVLTMTNLDTFTSSGGRLQIGVANGVNRAEGILYLAKTNIITLAGAAPQLYMGYNNGNNDGSTEFPILYLGQSNAFLVDSITVSADKQGNPASRVLFNPVFTNSNPTAYFRGITGTSSRVSNWILGNNSGQTTTGSISDGTNDFSFGTLDAMVDTMTIGISEKGAGATSGSGNGTFTFTAGTNNVNTLILGSRICTAGSSAGNGTMNVNGTATLIVNNAINLTTFAAGGNASYSTANLNINGGSVWANTITNGTTYPGSIGYVNANITMNGGTLGITSLLGSIGTTAWPLGIVTLNNATLQMPVSGLQTNFVTTLLNAGGTTNVINITSLPGVITYPTQFPLIAYYPGYLNGFNFGVSNLPSTYQGFISNNTANSTIDLVLTSGPTSITLLEWSGAANGNWDLASQDWLNAATPSTYFDGSAVLFDDTATGSTTVNLAAAFSPSIVTVNNNTLPYTFGGSGAIIGTGSLIKSGTGTLVITNSGLNTYSGNIVINAGSVQFGGGGTGGTFPPTGSVTNNGNLIFNHSDNLTVPNVISGTGTLTKNSSDVLTLTGPNSFSGATIVNTGTLLVNGALAGSLNSAAGSTVGGSGTNLGLINISGAIQPSAALGTPATFTSGSDVTLSSGATLKFSLNGPNSSAGGGVNDLLMVGGNLNANNNNVTVSFVGVPLTGTPYTLINFNGSQSGSFNSTVTGTHYAASLSQGSSPVTVTLAGAGANLTWSSTASAIWDVGVTTNWLNQGSSSPDVFYAGDTVLFDDTAAITNITINNGVLVSPVAITNNSTHNYTIGGSGQLNGPINIVKQGSSTLTLSTPNPNFTGNLFVQAGTVAIGNNTTLGPDNGNGSAGPQSATISSGATMDLKGSTVNSAGITAVGTGINGLGAIINSGADQIHAIRYLTLTGDTTFGGSGRWDIRFSGNNLATLNGDGADPFKITKVGTNIVALVDVSVDQSLGDIDIQGGTFGIELTTLSQSGSWAGSSAHTIAVETNATLELGISTPATLSQTIALMNGSTLLSDAGANVLGGSVTLQGNSTINVTTLGLTVSGVVSGAGNLIKSGASPLAIAAAATYAGSTLVNAGTLQLGVTGTGDGSLASTNIVIASGAIVDVSQRSDQTLSLVAGQLLQGSGTINGALVVGAGATVSAGTNYNNIGTLTVTNGVTLAGNTLLKLNAATKTNDVILATNSPGITYGGTLTVTNISATALAAGNSFQLFTAASYSGAFTSIVPATPGAGLLWNTNTLSSGALSIVSGVVPQPHITGMSLSGGTLIINGTNGVAGEQYNLLTTTNLALALTNWTVLPTNTFSAGTFSITNAVNPNAPQSYYILRVP